MINERDFIDEMVLTAINQGDFYPNDALGSANTVFETFIRDLRREWREDYRSKVALRVSDYWKGI